MTKGPNEILEKILNLLSLIGETKNEELAQKKIFELNHILLESDDETGIEELDDYLPFLGMDLEHYVQNPTHRAENRLFYGFEELKKKVSEAQKKIGEILEKK